MLDMTRGESGCLAEGMSFEECAATRTREEEAVAAMLNADLHFLGERDVVNECHASAEICRRASQFIIDLNPRAMFIHWPLDVHVDHAMCFAAMYKALHVARNTTGIFYDPEIFFHEHTVQTKGFTHNCYVDITDVFEKKIELIRLYTCQNVDDCLVKNKTLDAKFHGARCGVPYAESFAIFHPERLRTRPTVIEELALK